MSPTLPLPSRSGIPLLCRRDSALGGHLSLYFDRDTDIIAFSSVLTLKPTALRISGRLASEKRHGHLGMQLLVVCLVSRVVRVEREGCVGHPSGRPPRGVCGPLLDVDKATILIQAHVLEAVASVHVIHILSSSNVRFRGVINDDVACALVRLMFFTWYDRPSA